MMRDLIKKALDHAGYELEPTESNLIECFLDYAASGAYANLDYDEAKDLVEDGEIRIKSMCYNLLKVK